jgi:methylmalonyl-CoA/ethylmalonyl-CoA epimerase
MDECADMQFDHVGVVVREMDAGREFFAKAFAIGRWTEVFVDRGIGVSVQFGLGASGPCYELIAPLHDGSPVSAALRSGHRILNHVAYRTADLAAQGERLASLGCTSAAPAHPAVAYGGSKVQFWVSPLRMIFEIIEAPEHRHIYLPSGESLSEPR